MEFRELVLARTENLVEFATNIKYRNEKRDIYSPLKRFVEWLDRFGEYSQDQYDYWSSQLGQHAKKLYYKSPWIGAAAVAPFIFLDAFFPGTRRLFSAAKRFPIADAHYAMGFSNLYKATGKVEYYNRAVHFLNVLEHTRCPGYEHYCWGYPFDWMGKGGISRKNTPLITTIPYVYEAFGTIYEIDNNKRWLEIMRSISEHIAFEYRDIEIKNNIFICSYASTMGSSNEKYRHVVNANSYRAFLLTDAAQRFSRDEYRGIAEGNLAYVLDSQQPDGSWLYATDGTDPFIDHFHTCFVLKNLIKIEKMTDNKNISNAIKKGIEFYLEHLIDERLLPKPFAKSQNTTFYRKELYDYAESLNLAILFAQEIKELKNIIDAELSDLLERWQKPDGSFRTRHLLLGWNNVPYHRWAQSQLFRSLSLLLSVDIENEVKKTSKDLGLKRCAV